MLKVLSFIFCFIILFSSLRLTYALEMESIDFHINLESIDTQTDSSTNTIGQPYIKEFETKGYIIKNNAPNLSNPFVFSLSSADVNFGEFISNTIKSNHIDYVVNSGSPGFQISALQETPFKTLSGNTITDTNSNYGFGFNLSKESKTNYRAFPLKTLGEEETIIMSSRTQNTDKITINFKLNIPPTQPKGSYRTIVNFVVLPGY